METKSDKGRGECIGEREQSNVRRCKVKEIDGVAVSEGKGQESWINEINAEEGSGEKRGDRRRREAAGERERGAIERGG